MCIRDRDEPSNHLDAETKEALQQALQDFQGTVLLLSLIHI